MSMALQTTYPTTPAIGFAGTPDASYDPANTMTMIQAESSASMPFGSIVAGQPSATNDKNATLPANSTDVLVGVLLRSDAYAPAFTTGGVTIGDLDSVGLRPGATLNIARKGKVLVVCEDGCTAFTSRLFVRYAGGTKGAARATDAGGSTCIDATKQGQWVTSAAAAGLAWLEFSFVNHA